MDVLEEGSHRMATVIFYLSSLVVFVFDLNRSSRCGGRWRDEFCEELELAESRTS